MKLFRRLHKQLTAAQAEDAMVLAEQQLSPGPAPIPVPAERVLCYSPNGGYAHDDTGGVAPRPACSAAARQWTRAESPEKKQRAASLKPCPHCARLREASSEEGASA
jgi:hypothetical protein